jgi:hypothetical protein
VVRFQVYETGPVFLPLLALTFWNHVKDGQQLFLNFRDILLSNGGPIPGGNVQVGRDVDHSPPYSAEVKNV